MPKSVSTFLAVEFRTRAARLATQSLFIFVIAATVHAEEPLFNADVRPILAKHCFACHGRDESSREAELRLDDREAAIEAKAISPGNPAASELVARIESADPEVQMPPAETGDSLSKTEIETLRQWIAAGAKYEKHWSFVAPKIHPLPATKQNDWPLQPLDHFVLSKLEDNNMKPAADANRSTWLRRVSLDLTGLPPTLAEAEAFLTDESDEAFETVVDRLLASEAYGERWARVWLDLARYADTKGYEKDKHRNIWRYRDWVIDALNRDLPYDQFTIEQLAGDLLPDRTTDQILATAFHRNTMTNDEGGTDNEEFRVAAVKDRADTTLQVWMGLTAGCAKCHSHKYDPISINDYYAFYAFFNQSQDADNEAPFWATPTADHKAKIDELNQQIKVLEGKPEHELKPIKDQLAQLNKAVPQTPVMLELDAGKQRVTRIHNRGNFLDQGDEVAPAVPASFGALPPDSNANRHAMALWLMQPENPLTARVMVNRIWARLFGVGIVKTEEDFGTQGMPPTHPELLDTLAVDFREQGWSIKKLLRGIVLSRTYRQSSNVTAEQLAKDPQNCLLGRGPRFRLSAEAVRDQALAVSGLLTQKVGGPSVMPPQPDGVWKSTYSGETWKNAVGPDRYRRSLYTYLKRTSPYPAMITFDAGSGEVCQVRRVRTNTPLQALVTLNDTVFLEAAGALAGVMQEAGDSTEAQIAHGFKRVLVRDPSSEELKRLVDLYNDLDAELENGEELLKAAGVNSGDPQLVVVANVLLNLDETLTKP